METTINNTLENKHLTSEFNKLCPKCKRLFPEDMLKNNSSRSESWGLSIIFGVCPDCANAYTNFDKNYTY